MRLKFSVAPAVALVLGFAGTAAAQKPVLTYCGGSVFNTGAVDQIFAVSLTVTGGTTPYIITTSMPWLTVVTDPANPQSVTVFGFPPAPIVDGTVEFTLVDATGLTDTATFSIYVDPAGSPVITGSPSPLVCIVGQPCTGKLASAGSLPIMWFPGSQAPTGFAITSDGPAYNTATFTWTPAMAGSYAPSVVVATGLATALWNQCINVLQGPALGISYGPFPPTTTKTPISKFPALAGSATATFSALSPLPTGLSLDSNTGALTGTIAKPGLYPLTIGAATGSLTANTTVIIPVEDPCDCDQAAPLTSAAAADVILAYQAAHSDALPSPGELRAALGDNSFSLVLAGGGGSDTYSDPRKILYWDGIPVARDGAGGGGSVNPATGAVEGATIDLNLHNPVMPLVSSHGFSTVQTQNGNPGLLGTGWTNFDTRIVLSGDPIATVMLPGGKQVQFLQSGDTWVAQAAEPVAHELVNTANGFQFLDLSTNVIYNFSTTGALTGIVDRNGNTLTVTQGLNGPTSVSDGLGRTLTFSYNAAGQLIKVSDQTGRSVLFGYTGTNLTSFTDANGGVTKYSYTPVGSLITSETLPVGNTPATNAYNANSQVQSVTDSFQNQTTFSYNANAGQTTITDALGNPATDTNLDSYVLTKQTDALNHSSSIAYDSNFRPTLFTDQLGNQTSMTYLAAAGYPASRTDALGNITAYTYAFQIQGAFTYYNLTTVNFADGTSITFTYDASGNVLTATDQAGDVTAYTYNSRGQVLTITNPAGGVTTVTYNADATAATSTDPAGNKTSYAYDALKRLIQLTFADGTTYSVTYDPLDRVLTTTNELGKVTTLVYDANGNPTRVTDPLNDSSTAAFDTNDRITKATDPLGNSTTLAYNAVSNPQSITDAAAETTTFTYDVLNRVTNIADPAGNKTTYGYDADGDVTSIADPLSNTVTFVIDQLRRVTQAATPLGETYSRTFDQLGRVTSVTNPLSEVTNFAYESRGLIKSIAAPLGISASFTHDPLGLLNAITDPNGNIWTRQHDATGRLTQTADPLGHMTAYSYDPRNRPNKITSSLGSAQITYDAAGNWTQIQYTDGTSKNYTYDADNRVLTGNGLTQSFDAAGNLSSSNGEVNTWDAVHRMASVTYEPGKTVTYTYNSRGLLATVTDWAGGSIAFAYDNAARRISMVRSNGVTTQYGYDKDSQVSTITEILSNQTIASTTLQHDANGNVTSAVRNVPQAPNPAPGVTGFSYDAAEQVSGDSYDALGRLTKDALRAYTWDLASELTAFNGTNGSAVLGYNGFGMLTSVTTGGATQNFVWNNAFGLPSIATAQSGGADARYNIYAPDGELLYGIDAAGNVRHWYHFDETGSTIFLSSDAGQITDSYAYTPYGETVNAVGNTPNLYTWLGKLGVMDLSGLYYMRARWYDPTSQRFLSRDPLGAFTRLASGPNPTGGSIPFRRAGAIPVWLASVDPKALSPYQYALQNPLRYADPTGTSSADQFFPGTWQWAVARQLDDLEAFRTDYIQNGDPTSPDYLDNLYTLKNAVEALRNFVHPERCFQLPQKLGPNEPDPVKVIDDLINPRSTGEKKPLEDLPPLPQSWPDEGQ